MLVPRLLFNNLQVDCGVHCDPRSIVLATTQAALTEQFRTQPATETSRPTRSIDWLLFAGIAVAICAVAAGIRTAGISLTYFFQPTGALIVVGGTLGVILVTTPRHSLIHSIRRVLDLGTSHKTDRKALIEQVIFYTRAARRGGVGAVEPLLAKAQHPFLIKAMQLAIDIGNRAQLKVVLENELRMRERQGESDAKALEVAGGFAPTIGILGTVVGLIEVLRQFSNLQAVGTGIGTAFVSTIYGLALANLLLLPAAHRIRARVAEDFETEEMIVEGVLAFSETVHPSLIRMQLGAFLRETEAASVSETPSETLPTSASVYDS
jgi:chemotaxis protein MotA